jgi:DNA topoisomerase II
MVSWCRCIGKWHQKFDSILLRHHFKDGQKVEPEFVCPIIPFLLVNGGQGIGTGWSTFIPPYNPKDVIKAIFAKLDNCGSIAPLTPFATGFEGEIEPDQKGSGFVTFDSIKKINDKTVLIDELPLRMWNSKYKE